MPDLPPPPGPDQREPPELTDDELDAWWKKCAELTREGKANCYWAFGDVPADYVYSIARAVIAADRARRHGNQPVPVSERLPGPENCDAEGWCWWFDGFNWMLGDLEDWHSHWLPHHALPTLEATNA